MARSKLHLRIAQSPVLRYGLEVLSVSAALGGALLIERYHLHNITPKAGGVATCGLLRIEA
jgi:hypothetical protein